MNRPKPKHRARRHVAYLAIAFLVACGGGGGGGGTTPPPPPASNPVTFETMLTEVTITDTATGDPVSVAGLPLGSAEISVTP